MAREIKKLINIYEKKLFEELEDNSFVSLSSPESHFSKGVLQFKTVFSNAIILQCLHKAVPTATNKLIKENLYRFLMAQKSVNETFNYWDRFSKEYKTTPYPDDLDDTFCALSAIYLYDKESLSGKNLRNITDLLVAQEAFTGGPYYTWVTGKKDDIEWKDIDLAVNSNIVYFLSHINIELESIAALAEKAFSQGTISSRYYPSGFPVIYFISRWYKGALQKDFIKIIENTLKQKPHTFLDKLLVASSLIRCNNWRHPIVKKVFLALQDDPLIVNKAFPFYRGVNPFSDGVKYHAGSKALSLALTIEFLSLYAEKRYTTSNTKALLQSPINKIHKEVLLYVKRELSKAEGSIETYGMERLNLLNQDKDIIHITTLPYFTYLSMKKPQTLEDIVCVKLGAATVFGWLAYDIYDDFFDQHGSPVQLAAANFSLRQLTHLFIHQVHSETFNKFFHTTMNIVDNANAYEAIAPAIALKNDTLLINKVLYKHALSIKNIHQKSIGHVIAAIAIFALQGIHPSSKESQALVCFFQHYLDARQMIDDMHDWEDDLRSGKLNSASAQLVIHCHKKNISRIKINDLQELLWKSSITNLCNSTQIYIDRAEEIMYALDIFEEKQIFYTMLQSLKQSINSTLSQQKQAHEFISS